MSEAKLRDFDLDAVRTDGLVRAHRRGHRLLPGALRDHRRALLRVLDHRRRAHHRAHGRPAQSGPVARRLRRRRSAMPRTASSRSASRWPTSGDASSARSSSRTTSRRPSRRARPRSRSSSSTSACATCCSRRSTATRSASSQLDEDEGAQLVVLHDGVEETHDLDAFRFRIRALVREELERVATGARSAIDLSKVTEAETAALQQGVGEGRPAPRQLAGAARDLPSHARGAAPHARTPAPSSPRAWACSGSACVHLGEIEQAEEVFRIGIQYAQEGVAAADLFRRLGEALLQNDRPGEAIGPLRRALAFGGPRPTSCPRSRAPSSAAGSGSRPTPAFATRSKRGSASASSRTSCGRSRGPSGVALTGWKAKLARESCVVDDDLPCRRYENLRVFTPSPGTRTPGFSLRETMIATYAPMFLLLATAGLIAAPSGAPPRSWAATRSPTPRRTPRSSAGARARAAATSSSR